MVSRRGEGICCGGNRACFSCRREGDLLCYKEVLTPPLPRYVVLYFCQVAKAQLDEDMCVEAIASYIKAEDPSYYAEVRERAMQQD